MGREYALRRLPAGQPADRDAVEPLFTRYALMGRVADYFKRTRTPGESWKQLEDLAPQLAELELRHEGQDYDNAAAAVWGSTSSICCCGVTTASCCSRTSGCVARSPTRRSNNSAWRYLYHPLDRADPDEDS